MYDNSLLNTEVEKLLSDEQIEELNLCLDDAEYFEKIQQFQVYIDEVISTTIFFIITSSSISIATINWAHLGDLTDSL